MTDDLRSAGRRWTQATWELLGTLVPDDDDLTDLSVPLKEDECVWFVRGWEAGLYPVGRCPEKGVSGVCAPERLDHFLTTSGGDRHLLTRWTQGGWGVSREYVTHLGAFSRAVLEYGYSLGGALLSHYGRYTRDLITRKAGGSYEIDAAFPLGRNGGTDLLIEAKADPRDVARWAEAIERGASPTDLVGIGFKEVEYVLDLEPRHLWLVGPGSVDPASHVWEVSVDGLEAEFTPLEDVPRRPLPAD